MSFQSAKPSWPLSLFIKQYWAIENCVPTGQTHIQRIVPSGLTELTFYLNDRPNSLDKGKDISDNVILSGHLKGYYDIAVSGKLSMFSVSFMPLGIYMFMNMPADELYDLNVPFRFIFPEIANQLEDQLYEADSFSEKVIVTERFLKGLLNNRTKSYSLDRITKSIDTIKESKGLIEINALSDITCLSRKQFERLFSNIVGISPKQYLKTIRFQWSLHYKHQHPATPLTEIAYISGYYDQAHMINDFKSLSGMTPGQYFKDCDPFSDYFNSL